MLCIILGVKKKNVEEKNKRRAEKFKQRADTLKCCIRAQNSHVIPTPYMIKITYRKKHRM